MGTKVQSKSFLPGYYSMRDLNEDSKICWPLYQSDKSSQNGQYFMQRVAPEAYPGYDKDTVKQTMLEHEAVFKKQVNELHRLYRIQRDMMDEFRMKEVHRNRMQIETSFSSEDARKWNNQSFPMVNSNPYHSHNGLSSKDVEVLESRPSKLRRKTFDLQLPADEYIDTEEGEKSRMPLDYGVKFFSQEGKVETQNSERRLRSPNGLADLNEPIIHLEDVKETNVSSYGLSNAKVLDFDQSANPNLRQLGLAKEISIRTYGSDGSIQNSSNLPKSGNGWLSHALEAGQRKSNLSIPQYLQIDKSPLSYQPTQVSMNKVHEPYFQCLDKSKSELWKEKTGFGVERTPDLNSGTSLASHIRSPYQISPPDLAKPWSHSWEKPSIKPLSTQNDGIFGDRWSSGGEYLYRNGFHQGSPSGSKEQPIHIPSSSNENIRVSRNSADDGLAKCHKVSDLGEMKSPKDMNLNVAILDLTSDQERTVAALPWLRAKPACKKELVDSSHFSKSGETSMNRSPLNQSPCKNQTAKGCNQQFANSGDCQAESSRSPNNKRLLGFPIFEKPNISMNEASCLTSENKVVSKLSRILDMNLPCDSFQQDEAEVVVESVTEAKSGSFRHLIDLNSCLSDDESSLNSSTRIARVRGLVEIDLEVPAVPESEDEALPEEENQAPESSLKCNGPQEDELLTVAAEAIVAISVSSFSYLSETQSKESCFADPLTWFVEIVSSCGEAKVNDDLSEEFDHFESMILQLAETKEEDYMPAPLILESLKLEEAGRALPTGRPRKGQGRRGRQRRDFQRDILPGLASLSRHEVTEDLQIFGGLMRATGQSWHSGRRNGGGRGRRRAAVSPPSPPAPATPPSGPPQLHQLTIMEAGRDDRRLAGWGKTTRRPRRQRCPPSIPITLSNG